MRFKKGSKVEVMNKAVPASWCVAEIVSGNGHSYNVRYDDYQGVEKVSRRFIRPFPPATSSHNLVTGDVVEVFDENSWKIATVSEVLSGGRFLVRPHGFTHELRVCKTNIRARQSWQDGQWIPIGKISGSHKDVKVGKAVGSKCSLKMGIQVPLAGSKTCQEEDDCLPMESHVISRNRKRASPFCSSILQAYPGKVKKFKPAKKDHNQSQSQSQRYISGHSFEKVDAFAYPGDNILGNKYMQASFNNSLNGYYEMEKTLARISDSNDSDNDQCSVGSCSVIPSDGPDIVSSDGESSFNTSRDEELAVSIHRLELHAYRSTLEALYASGPLSWEKEALLTNLRINLHISNDEHLTELRHLISSGAGFLDYQGTIGGMHLLLPKVQTRSWFCCLSSWKKQWDIFSINLLQQIRLFVAILALIKRWWWLNHRPRLINVYNNAFSLYVAISGQPSSVVAMLEMVYGEMKPQKGAVYGEMKPQGDCKSYRFTFSS